MSTPTITTIDPDTGHTGGYTLVEITGTNFALPPAADDTAVTPAPGPTVSVTFGGVPALDVVVESATKLYAVSPVSPTYTTLTQTDANGNAMVDIGPGVVNIVVTNLDTAGDPVSGETVTAAAAFTYVRPDLAQASTMSAAVGRFIEELRRQVVANVDMAVHTDYSDNDASRINLAYLPQMPALVILSVGVREAEAPPEQGQREVTVTNERFAVTWAPEAVDLVFELLGVGEHVGVVMSLFQALRRALRRKLSKIHVPKVPSDYAGYTIAAYHPSQWAGGYTEHPIDVLDDGATTITSVGGASKIKTFSMRVRIRNVVIEDIPGLPTQGTTETPSDMPHDRVRGFGTVVGGTDIASFRQS